MSCRMGTLSFSVLMYNSIAYISGQGVLSAVFFSGFCEKMPDLKLLTGKNYEIGKEKFL